jgi:hypothetical protein
MLRPPPSPCDNDTAEVVQISRRRKSKFGEDSNLNQEQTFKVPPEILTIVLGQQLTMWNH